ncbi:MAG: sigma-54-dependent Fis family transcriptional regulator, partial [Clostridia bacterium]|nr:sigma-54-dependent Fis family transcriptional regulator [Clostridia bacterium]
DYIAKPLDLNRLLVTIRNAIEKADLVKETKTLKQEATQTWEMIGRSPAMMHVKELIDKVAPSNARVLIQGSNGTGKELVARWLHEKSPRAHAPFIEVNCAAIPSELIESQLFGHEKGSFTSAIKQRKGDFELAHGGTLFLDEIGDMSLSAQAKVLRALQEKSISRIGGEQQIAVDVRIVAATNRDLKQMTADGGFREDLYFRLNVITIGIPPLRQRKEDIPALIDFFLAKYQSQARFDDQALHQLTKYHYPGNIRELEHILQRTVTLARSPHIGLRDLPPEVRDYQGPSTENSDLNQRLAEIERQLLTDALERHNWVQTRAADSLGISERVLRYKMERLGIVRK